MMASTFSVEWNINWSTFLDQDWDTNTDFWRIIGGDKKKIKSAELGGVDENYWRSSRDTISLWR